MSKAPLEAFQMPLACGSRGWGFRWSFARAPVLLDRTGRRLQAALLRQATITDGEAESILIEHDRICSWLTYDFRSLTSDRDGRPLGRKLGAAVAA